MAFINYNGKILKEKDVFISPDNRSFRYGDGFFETMKFINGNIVLKQYHFERLFSSLELMQFEKPAFFFADNFDKQIKELASANQHSFARIRCTFFRGNGGLFDPVDHQLNYIIQSWPLNEASNLFNENGLMIDVFKEAIKHADSFSQIKSNNFLPYVMGALWAKRSKLNDAILLNPFGYITDTTIANIFIVKDGTLCTPPLSDGPVNGTMRRHLLTSAKAEGIPVNETSIHIEELYNASEVFLTNAVAGIRWVKQAGRSNYTNQLSSFLFKKFIEPLYK